MLQVKDAALERGQAVLDRVFALREQNARLHDLVRGRFLRRRMEVFVVDRFHPRPRTAKAAVHLVARDTKDPDQQARVALIALQRAEHRHEHFLRDILGFAAVAHALQRESEHAREVGLVEHLEVGAATAEDLRDQLGVALPGNGALAARPCGRDTASRRRGTSRGGSGVSLLAGVGVKQRGVLPGMNGFSGGAGG